MTLFTCMLWHFQGCTSLLLNNHFKVYSQGKSSGILVKDTSLWQRKSSHPVLLGHTAAIFVFSLGCLGEKAELLSRIPAELGGVVTYTWSAQVDNYWLWLLNARRRFSFSFFFRKLLFFRGNEPWPSSATSFQSSSPRMGGPGSDESACLSNCPFLHLRRAVCR